MCLFRAFGGAESSVRVQVTRMLTLENPARAVAYSPDADLIAVGFGSPLETSQVGQIILLFNQRSQTIDMYITMCSNTQRDTQSAVFSRVR